MKIGDIVRLRDREEDCDKVFRVSGMKSDFRALWILLDTNPHSTGVTPYPIKHIDCWLNSNIYEVIHEGR